MKARLSYMQLESVHDSSQRCEERSDIEELVNWRTMSWWRYMSFFYRAMLRRGY